MNRWCGAFSAASKRTIVTIEYLSDSTPFGDRRSFGDWSMGFSAIGNAPVVMGFIDADITENLSSLNKEKAIEILKTLSRKTQREPA